MSCNDKKKFRTSEASTKASLRTKGAIDAFLNILDYNKFNSLNNEWTNIAKERFNINGKLFSQENNKAIPNKQAFKQIDNAKGIFYQEDEIVASKSSPETLAKVRDVIKAMGVVEQDLVTYMKQTGLTQPNLNGLSDAVRGIIAIAEGKEDVALTEEMVHIATAIINLKNPQMITEMISKIDRFEIYNRTLNDYKNDPAYQLPNGKPDIRKIKKEAVDKLIAELIINESEGSVEFPELMAESNRSLVRRFWDSILDFFRGQY